MITRRNALTLATLPLVMLPFLQREAEAVEGPPEQKGDGRTEMITHYYALDHHDPIQLGLVPDLPKAVGEALRFAEFILESSERAKVPMPGRFHEMVERLKNVQASGRRLLREATVAFSDTEGRPLNPVWLQCSFTAKGRAEPLESYVLHRPNCQFCVDYPDGVEALLMWRFKETLDGPEHRVVDQRA